MKNGSIKVADESGELSEDHDNERRRSICFSPFYKSSSEKLGANEVMILEPDGPISDPEFRNPRNSRVKRSRKPKTSSKKSPKIHTDSSVDDLFVAKLWLETLASAVVITGGTGRIRFANDEALSLLDEGDAIMVDSSGILRCRDTSTQRQLAALTRSISTGWNEKRTEFRAIGFPRDFRLPLSAIVIVSYPAPSGYRPDEPLDESRILFIFRDPERVPPNIFQRLEALFRFTKAESQVVGLLAIGMSIKEIAVDRAVSLATVRNQLKSAQSKIGVSRQAELVSVVLRSV